MLHLNCCILSLQSLVIFDTFEYTYRVLKYVITMVGFQSVLFNMSFKLKSSLWTGPGGLCICGIALVERWASSQHRLLCGGVFNLINLYLLYWATKLMFYLKHSRAFI